MTVHKSFKTRGFNQGWRPFGAMLLGLVALTGMPALAQTIAPSAPRPGLVPHPYGPAVAGPQGIAGPQGPPGISGTVVGDAGLSGLGISALAAGVTADNGVTDNAPYLIAARALSAATHNAKVTLPPGTIGLNTPWLLTSPDYTPPGGVAQPGQDCGPIITGAGPSTSGDPAKLGTALVMRAAGQSSVVNVGRGFMVMGRIQDLSLVGYNSLSDTGAGLLFSESNFSDFRAQNLNIQFVQTAVKVLYHTGNADGECIRLDNINALRVDCFYDNETTQAVSDYVDGGQVTLNSGGVAFILGAPGGGGGVQFHSSELSVSYPNASVTNRFLSVQSLTSASFADSRVEKCGVVDTLPYGVYTERGIITHNNCYFTAMPDGATVVRAAIGTGGSQIRDSFSYCRFDPLTSAHGLAAGSPGSALHILGFVGGAGTTSDVALTRRIEFHHCIFSDWGSIVDKGLAPAAGAYAGVLYDDCWRDVPTNTADGMGGYKLVPLTN